MIRTLASSHESWQLSQGFHVFPVRVRVRQVVLPSVWPMGRKYAGPPVQHYSVLLRSKYCTIELRLLLRLAYHLFFTRTSLHFTSHSFGWLYPPRTPNERWCMLEIEFFLHCTINSELALSRPASQQSLASRPNSLPAEHECLQVNLNVSQYWR